MKSRKDTPPILLKDGYKVDHRSQYEKDTLYIYSNITPRSSRVKEINAIVVFGVQYLIKRYLIDDFNENFFGRPKEEVVAEYKRRIDHYLGYGAVTYDHIGELYDLRYLPLEIKALPEGTISPVGVPMLTITNTDPRFFWLTNMLETLMSCVLWKAVTSATTAHEFRKNFYKYAKITSSQEAFVEFQGHDFSMRGMSGPEDARLSGAAHLLSFKGTDTLPAIDLLEQYYAADCEKETIGLSVPATEHSVMSMGLQENEIETFKRLITEVYPSGIVSIVSDTWDFWKVIKEILPALKDIIRARNGKVVIRPDSGDPVKIVCGDPDAEDTYVRKGVIECLWDIFGGTVNAKGFKELDSHIGLIYGDGINLDRQQRMLDGLMRKGFASTNIVLGMGSFLYQHVTRDTFGMAMKATFGVTRSRGEQAIFKDPKTDDGMKRSHKGLLSVRRDMSGSYYVLQNCTVEQEQEGCLKIVFLNGLLCHEQTLEEIRNRIRQEQAIIDYRESQVNAQ